MMKCLMRTVRWFSAWVCLDDSSSAPNPTSSKQCRRCLWRHLLIEHAHVAGNNIWHRGHSFRSLRQHGPRSATALPASRPQQVNWSTPHAQDCSAIHFFALPASSASQTACPVGSRRRLLWVSVGHTLSQEAEQGCRWTPFKIPDKLSASAAALCPYRIFPAGLRRCGRLCTPGSRSPGPWRQGKAHPLVALRLEPQERCRTQDPLCQVGRPR